MPYAFKDDKVGVGRHDAVEIVYYFFCLRVFLVVYEGFGAAEFQLGRIRVRFHSQVGCMAGFAVPHVFYVVAYDVLPFERVEETSASFEHGLVAGYEFFVVFSWVKEHLSVLLFVLRYFA